MLTLVIISSGSLQGIGVVLPPVDPEPKFSEVDEGHAG